MYLRAASLSEGNAQGAEGAQSRRQVGLEAALSSHTPSTCSALLLRVLFRKSFQETHCAGPQSMPLLRLHVLRLRSTKAFSGWEPAGPPPALTSFGACSQPSLICTPQAFKGFLQCVGWGGGHWGLAQMAREPSMEAWRLLRQSGRNPRPVSARALLLIYH